MTTPRAKYEITAEDKSAAAWKSSIENGKKASAQLANLFKGVAAFTGLTLGARAFGEELNKAIQRGDKFDRLAGQLNTTVEYLSQTEYMARKLDIEFDQLAGGFDTMAKNVSMAAVGLGRAGPALKSLGIDAKELIKLGLDEQVETIAEAISGLATANDRSRISMQIFGDVGAGFVNTLAKGRDGVRALREESDKMGFTMSAMAAGELAEMDDMIKRLTMRWDTWTSRFAYGMALIAKDTGLLPKTELEEAEDKYRELDERLRSLQKNVKPFEWMKERGIFPADSQKQIDAFRKSIAEANRALDDQAKVVGQINSRSQEDPVEKKRLLDPAIQKEMEENFEYLDELGRKRKEYDAKVDEATDQLRKEFADYYLKLDAMSQTSVEKQVADLREKLDATKTLLDADLITYEQYVQRRQEILDDALPEIQVTNDKIYADTKETVDRMSEYWASAQRNMQSLFADFLYDPFKDGIDGMLKSFVNMLRRMAAEAASAQIFEKLFGKDGKSGSLGGEISDFLSSVFGGGAKNPSTGRIDNLSGARALGGPVLAGNSYLVGERGPELFTANSNGTITPNNQLGMNFAPKTSIYIGAGNNVTRAEVKAAVAEGNRELLRHISDASRRGR